MAALTKRISPTGVVTVMNTAINKENITKLDFENEKKSIEAIKIKPVPKVAPNVGACTRS